MENILDITKFAFQGDAMQRLSSVLHESRNATQHGIEAAIPASLAGLAAQASSEQKAADLLGTFRGGNFPHADANDVSKMVDDPAATARLAQSSQGFLSGMFGNRLNGVVDALAGQAGVSRASASTMLGLAAPLVLSAVSKEAEARHLDARGLSRFLADQGRRATGALPGSLSGMLSSIPGFGSLGRAGEGAAGHVREVAGEVVERTGDTMGRARDRVEGAVGDASRRARGAFEDVTHRISALEHERAGERRHLGWLIAGLGLLTLTAYLVFRARGPETTISPPDLHLKAPSLPAVPKMPEVPKIETPPIPDMPKAAPQVPAITKAPETLSPSTGSSALATFLAGSEAAPRRFVLRGVEFASGAFATASATILDDVAATLNSHPTAKVRIEGHTDATGSAAGNQALSEARATAVKGYLVSKGVDASRLTTVGKGFDEPLVETSGANAENRRVELVVTEH